MKDFDTFLIESGVVGFKDDSITLKSGKISYWYANCRNLSKNFSTLETTAYVVVDFIQKNNLLDGSIDAVLGVCEGATLLGYEVHRKLVKESFITDSIFLPRVKTKEHGDIANKYWTTGIVPKKVIVIEDVTTTGGSAISFCKNLRDSGVEVACVVGLINRMQLDNGKTVVDSFKENLLTYYNVTDAQNILSRLVATEQNDERREKMRTTINKEYKTEYGENTPPVSL